MPHVGSHMSGFHTSSSCTPVRTLRWIYERAGETLISALALDASHVGYELNVRKMDQPLFFERFEHATDAFARQRALEAAWMVDGWDLHDCQSLAEIRVTIDL
jgi:hypothetical protein